MKHVKQNDAKRRKLDKNDENNRGSRNADKSNDKQHMHKKKNTKFGGDSKFSGSGGKAKTNVDKSNNSKNSGGAAAAAAASKKKLKKPKKPKGKKKSHRNKNK